MLIIKTIAELKTALKDSFEKFIELDSTTPLPIENKYKTKETLGKDRLALAVGAFDLYPESNCLIIDAGTAITYDIVTEKKQYLGWRDENRSYDFFCKFFKIIS